MKRLEWPVSRWSGHSARSQARLSIGIIEIDQSGRTISTTGVLKQALIVSSGEDEKLTTIEEVSITSCLLLGSFGIFPLLSCGRLRGNLIENAINVVVDLNRVEFVWGRSSDYGDRANVP
jgi:hypothetical protein